MSNSIVRARNGDTQFFKRVPVEQIINLRDDEAEESVLFICVKYNHIHCSRVVLERCPSLLYQQNIFGSTALHYAAHRGTLAIVNLLIHFAEKKLFRMRDYNGDVPIMVAIKCQQLDTINLLIQADLDYDYREISSDDSLLLAALKLSYGCTSDHISVKMRQLILEKQPSQCKLRSGRYAWTALHHATRKGDLDAILDIIQFCPESMNLVDRMGCNFLHIAVEHEHMEVVKYILREKKIAASLINMKNNAGYTPLDIAAWCINKDIISCLEYALSNVNEPTIADYENERVKKLCVPSQYLDLYWKLVRHFGEIAPPEKFPSLEEFLSIVSDIINATPYTTHEKIGFWEKKVGYYIGMGLQVRWLQKHITRINDWFTKKVEDINHLENEIGAKAMGLNLLEDEIKAKEKEFLHLEHELLHLRKKKATKKRELTSLRVEYKQLPLDMGFTIFDE